MAKLLAHVCGINTFTVATLEEAISLMTALNSGFSITRVKIAGFNVTMLKAEARKGDRMNTGKEG